VHSTPEERVQPLDYEGSAPLKELGIFVRIEDLGDLHPMRLLFKLSCSYYERHLVKTSLEFIRTISTRLFYEIQYQPVFSFVIQPKLEITGRQKAQVFDCPFD